MESFLLKTIVSEQNRTSNRHLLSAFPFRFNLDKSNKAYLLLLSRIRHGKASPKTIETFQQINPF